MITARKCAVASSVLLLALAASGGLAAREPSAGAQNIFIIICGEKTLQETYDREYAWIGIYFQSVTRSIAKKLDYPGDKGIIVTKVIANSPAERDGIEDGDIIISFGGTAIDSEGQFGDLVKRQRPNDIVSFVIFRKGEKKKLDVRLGKREDMPVSESLGRYSTDELKSAEKALSSVKNAYIQAFLMRARIGINVRSLSEDLAGYFGVKRDEGVLVLDVHEGSPADEAGVRGGDVIVAVNGVPVSNAEVVLEVLSDAKPGSTVTIEAVRKGARKTFEIEAPSGFGSDEFYVNPFEGSELEGRVIKVYPPKRDSDAEDLEKEIKRLRERMRELERRLEESGKK